MRYIWTVPGVSEGDAATVLEATRAIGEHLGRVGTMPAYISDTAKPTGPDGAWPQRRVWFEDAMAACRE